MYMTSYPMKEISVRSSEHEIYESLEVANMPDNMRMPMVRWVKYGYLPGGFLQALLRNDLCDAINRADQLNLIHLYTWAKWLQNAAPSGCYGSRENVQSWEDARRHDRLQEPPKKEG